MPKLSAFVLMFAEIMNACWSKVSVLAAPSAIIAVTFLAMTGAAQATATVQLYAYYEADLVGYIDSNNDDGVVDLPPGVTGDSIFDQASFHASISSGHQEDDYSATQTATITNSSDISYPGYLVYFLSVSAFNPGGPAIGVSVDDPSREFASFSSQVDVFGSLGDFHSCETSIAEPACGVMSPDSSYGYYYFSVPDPGQSYTLDGFIDTSYVLDVKPAPESSTLSMFGAILFCFFAYFGLGGFRTKAQR